MPDQPKQSGSPQQGQAGQQGQQQGNQQEDQELTDFLKDHEGHNDATAKHALSQDREGVKARHKKHKEQHGR